MKIIYKIVVFAVILSVSGLVSAQPLFTSGFESWTSNLPDGWVGSKTTISHDSIIQYTASVHSGTSACKLQSSSSSHKRFNTQALPVISGKSYKITFWVRGKGEIRTGMYKGAGASYYPYNAYIIVDSLDWVEYSQTIVVDTTSAAAEFIFSVRNTRADKDHLQIDDVTIDTLSSTPVDVKIRQIQYTTNPGGASPYAGQVVTTRGVVTATHSKGYFIQDSSGQWNGIYVLDSINAGSLNLGDSIQVTGLVNEYFNFTEIINVSAFSVLASGTAVPAPYAVTSVTVKNEDVESVLVKITNATCTDTDAGYGMWTVNNGTTGADTCKIYNWFFVFTPTLNVHYDVTGPVYYAYSEYRIVPRTLADVQVTSGINEILIDNVNIYPNPASDYMTISNLLGVEHIYIMDITGHIVKSMDTRQTNDVRLDISDIQAGMYFIGFVKDGMTAGSRKLIKY